MSVMRETKRIYQKNWYLQDLFQDPCFPRQASRCYQVKLVNKKTDLTSPCGVISAEFIKEMSNGSQ